MSNNNIDTKKDYINFIENSEEFKRSVKDNKEINVTADYTNKVASKISILSKITLGLIVVFLLLGIPAGYLTEEIPITISVVISLIVTSILLEGFAEVIELLQKIKDK